MAFQTFETKLTTLSRTDHTGDDGCTKYDDDDGRVDTAVAMSGEVSIAKQ